VPTTLWVLASPKDPGLPVLDELPADVARHVGVRPEDFQDAPPPDAILVCSMRADALPAVWPLARGVRWVHSRSAGIENVLFPALVSSPVPLTNGRGVFSASLAEFVAGALLFFAKDFGRMRRSQAEGRWDPFDVEWVRGKTLGIVGYGDIGRTVAELLRPFGVRIVALRRRVEAAADPLVEQFFPPARRHELLARSDYVLVATPLTEDTRGLIGPAEIAALQRHAVVINIGRGPCVDEAALIQALEAHRIKGAALDVFESEPLPAGHPFYRLDNVLLSPHCADHTIGWLDEAMRFFVKNMERFRRGEPLLNVVDKRAGY
jgi:phosphoglycerate dehydrogenase-like enzyme